jgi:hypothetical protein
MKRSTAILLFVFSLFVVGFVGFMSKGDHRTDRNIPGSTTGAGKASVIDTQPTLEEQGLKPPPR